MNSRDRIFQKIRINKGEFLKAPNIHRFDGENGCERFKTALGEVAGRCFEASSLPDAEKLIQKLFPDVKEIASDIVSGTFHTGADTDASALDTIELVILKASFGVAENGALWLSESDMMTRALPFITQHLVLLLDRNKIVSDMLDAYLEIDPSFSYGVFIAGPSKTADIEQSLVIGAQGPRTLTVILLNSF